MNSILERFGFRWRRRGVILRSDDVPRFDDSSWLVKRPDEEGWKTSSSGWPTLGPGKYEYHERTKEFMKWVFGREFYAFDEVHPIVMAPFELASNRPVDTWNEGDDDLFDNFRDEVWNLTAEMALHIVRFTDHDKKQALGYLNSIDVQPPNSSEEIIVLFEWLLKEVTNGCFGGRGVSGPDTRDIVSKIRSFVGNFQEPVGPQRHVEGRFSHSNDAYIACLERWVDKYKSNIFDLLSLPRKRYRMLSLPSQRYRILKVQPDLSNVLIGVPEKAFPGTQVKAVFFHNARGMSLQNLGKSLTTARKRDKLKYRRGSWVKRSFKGMIAAWVWIAISIGLSLYRAFTSREKAVLEKAIKFIELLSIMTIAVFGFVKLIVYDDAVLFRLITGCC